MAKLQGGENKYWDEIADVYADEIMRIQPDFFKNSAVLINSELDASYYVADIGNGGVINYSFENLKKLDCIDLSVASTAITKYKKYSNIEFKQGNVFNLQNIPDNMYDRVILQCVIHHLAGKSYKITLNNTEQALRECMRILRGGGKLLIVESTVVPWFEIVEKIFYSLMQAFFCLIKFDTVYQYSHHSLVNLIKKMHLGVIESSHKIEIGKYMWLMRHKVLNKATPCRACWICVRKE